jgi:tRNA threonylcarbamoyladenosine biosynthesis protein TsaB
MKLLAIDTATEACSAALLAGDERRERYELAPRRHAELILPMVDSLLAESGISLGDLDAIAFGRGPGAFTGVRIATGVAQGLAWGTDLPLLPVSTLATLAQGAAALSPRLLCAMDARKDEVYWCRYEVRDGCAVAVTEEAVGPPETVSVTAGWDCYGIGSGWLSYAERLRGNLGDHLTGFEGGVYPHALDMLVLARKEFQAGGCVPAEQAAPVYLRDRVTGE